MSDNTKAGVAEVFAEGRHANPKDRSRVQSLMAVAPSFLLSPDQIPGLQYWLDASQPLYVSNGGARCANAGDVVGVVPDQSGNGRIPTATDITYDPVGLNGKPTLNFNGSTSRIVTPSFLDSSYDTAFTCFVVAKAANLAANKVMVGANQFFIQRNGATKVTSPSHSGVTPAEANMDYFSDTGVAAFSYDGAHTVFGYDRLWQTSGGSRNCSSFSNVINRTGNMGLSGALTIGATNTNGFVWPGQISEVLIYKRAFTSVELQAVVEYLTTKWSLAARPQVLVVANSLGSGTGSSGGATQTLNLTGAGGTNFPNQLWALLGSNWEVRTDAYPGRTTQQIISEVPAYGDLYWQSSAPKNIAIVWEGTNTMAVTQSAAVAYRQIIQACRDRRKAGFKVLVGTVLPRGEDGLYANFEADRQIYNALLRTNWSTFADGLADFAADSRIGAPGAHTNLTYYAADKIHLTDAGYAIVAATARDAVLLL